MRCRTCAGSNGAAIVTTAFTEAIRSAAAITAAPPSEWPIRIAGAPMLLSRYAAAATRSSTLAVKWLSANAPSLTPRPVKSKRSVAIPCSASARLTRRAPWLRAVQVKQCANTATARIRPGGSSIDPASITPAALGNRTSCFMANALLPGR